jgi:HK97 gp10 family phage protein
MFELDMNQLINDLSKHYKEEYLRIELNVRQATKEAAEQVQHRAAKLAPVDTGELRKNIKLRANKDGSYEVYVDSSISYAFTQEYGLSSRNIPPSPYMRPALNMTREFYYQQVQRAAAGGGVGW